MELDSRAYPRRVPETGDRVSTAGRAPEDARLRNWARNATLAPADALAAPADEAELRRLVTETAGGIRTIGSRMSPGRMLALAAPGDVLLDLSRLSGLVSMTGDTATFRGATPLAEVYATLSGHARMLPSSPGVIASQTLAGALSTGTHGQGLEQGCIADAALRLRMVLSDGSVLEIERDDPSFPALRLGLGLLGVITEVTLQTVPSVVYTCHKTAVAADTLADDLEGWNRANALTKAWWFPDDNQVHVWLANEASPAERDRYLAGGGELLEHDARSSALNATIDQTLVTMRSDTRILDEDGKPFKTVTRFKDFTDVTGDVYQVFTRGIATPQINVEIGVPLARAGEVVDTIKRWHAETRPHLHYPVILRCTGPSDSWLSPSYGQETCFFGFVVYYAEDGSLSPEGVDFLRAVEKLLAAAGGRPHWGKYFDEELYDWPALYPRWEEFRQVRERLDPAHRFENAFTGALFESTPARRVDAAS